MNDEVPDEGDYDAGRGRGEFDNITPEDFIHGGGSGHVEEHAGLDDARAEGVGGGVAAARGNEGAGSQTKFGSGRFGHFAHHSPRFHDARLNQ